jgi:hypothetical protein
MLYNLLHLLSTNHKCTHAYFIKIYAAQNKIIVRSSLKTLRSSRRMSPSHLPIKMKFRYWFKTFIGLLKIKTFSYLIKYFNTLFSYDIF